MVCQSSLLALLLSPPYRHAQPPQRTHCARESMRAAPHTPRAASSRQPQHQPAHGAPTHRCSPAAARPPPRGERASPQPPPPRPPPPRSPAGSRGCWPPGSSALRSGTRSPDQSQPTLRCAGSQPAAGGTGLSSDHTDRGCQTARRMPSNTVQYSTVQYRTVQAAQYRQHRTTCAGNAYAKARTVKHCTGVSKGCTHLCS